MYKPRTAAGKAKVLAPKARPVEGKREPATNRPTRDPRTPNSAVQKPRKKAKKKPRNDVGRLRVLSICHFVLTGLVLLGVSTPLLLMAAGVGIAGSLSDRSTAPFGSPELGVFFGMILFCGASLVLLLLLAVSALLLISGICLWRCHCRRFCMVTGVFSLVLVPFGTVLGIFTLVELSRPSVKELFARYRGPTSNPVPVPKP